jgi:hypothetical protein
MAEKIRTEDGGGVALQKRLAELEEANTQMEASNADMQLTVSHSGEAVTVLRHELDAELENYELLRFDNTSLLDERNEARGQVANLESELAEMNANTAKDTATMEARLAAAEAHTVEGSAAAERHLMDFCMKLTGDLAPLCQTYERNIQSLVGICSPIPGAAPSTQDYIRWLTSEMACLPEVFMSINKNFISMAIEGMLAMAGGADSVDLESLHRVAASCGMDILLGAWDARKSARAVWWRPSRYKSALDAIEARLHWVRCCARCF